MTFRSKHDQIIKQFLSVTLDSLRGSYVKIGTIQKRLAWPVRKDDTHNSRSVINLSRNTQLRVSLTSVGECVDRSGWIWLFKTPQKTDQCLHFFVPHKDKGSRIEDRIKDQGSTIRDRIKDQGSRKGSRIKDQGSDQGSRIMDLVLAGMNILEEIWT